MAETAATTPIAMSPRQASLAFDPPCGERVIRRAIKDGTLKTVSVGKRTFVLRTELARAAEAGELL